MLDGIFYCINNKNLSIYFRVRSRSPVTFTMKLYLTTINNNFSGCLFFYDKELHLRFFLGLELNIEKISTKILKDVEGSTHDQVWPWKNIKISLS